MPRAVVLAAIVSACISCKPGAPDDPFGHGASTSKVPGRGPMRRSAGAPNEVLAGKHRAPVTLEGRIPVSGGSAIVYTYGRLQSYLGERSAAGHDVVAELAAEQQRCDDERAALDPGEREWIEAEYQSCEAIAATTLFGDDSLVPECKALAVAYFAADGTLLSQVDVGGPCVWKLGSLEAYDLTPEPDTELMLIATFERFGELTRGGWGRTQEATSLHVLAIRPGVELALQLEVELDVSTEGGNCNSGIERSARVAGVGVLEVYSRPWNDCAQESCIDATEAEEAEAAGEPVEELPICQVEPVTAARTRWVPEERSWTVLEEFAYEGTQLPDGIQR
jgi:hypothetical protein